MNKNNNKKIKNLKIRSCIICFNKFNQKELIRLFIYKNQIPYLIYNQKIITDNNENIDYKDVMKNKSRSIYFCIECIKKNNINNLQKKITNYLKKIKNPILKNYLPEINNLIKKIK
ncbi:MAG: hypothetical protein ACP5RD_06300 [bacterium]